MIWISDSGVRFPRGITDWILRSLGWVGGWFALTKGMALSNTMLRGRRLLAAVSAGTLGAGLLIGLAAPATQAAVTQAGTGVTVPTLSSQGFTSTTTNGSGVVSAGFVRPNTTIVLPFAVVSDAADDTVTVSIASGASNVPITVGALTGGTSTYNSTTHVATVTTTGASGATGTVSFSSGIPGTSYTVTFSGGTNATLVAAPAIGVATPLSAARADGSDLIEEQVRFALPVGATAGTADYRLNVCAIGPLPTGVTYTPAAQTDALAAFNTNASSTGVPSMNVGLGTISQPGTYSLGLFARGPGQGSNVCTDGLATAGSQVITVFNQTFGGQIAAVTQAPTNMTLTVAGTQKVTVAAVDSAGRATLPTSTDSIGASSSTPAIATATPSQVAIAATSGALTYEVTGVAAGAVTVSATPINVSVPAAVSTVSVIAQATTNENTTIEVSQASVTETTNPAANIWARTYSASPTVSTLTFTMSGLTPSATYQWVLTPTGVNVGSGVNTARSGSITASAAGTASATFPVSGPAGASPVAGDSVQMAIPTAGVGAAGANQRKTATVTWEGSTVGVRTPAAGAVLYSAASAVVPVLITIADQYGNANAGATVQVRTGGVLGTVVGTGTTAANGTATVNVTAPASGQTVFTITGTSNLNVPLTASTFTVTTAQPTVTFTSGVSTSANQVRRHVPDQAVVSATEATQVVVTVANAGVPVNGAQVTFTGSEGVRFFTANPTANADGHSAWNAGTATPAAVSTAANGQATIWAYGTKTGTAKVFAAVSGVTAEGNFTVAEDPAGARNIAVTAPAEVVAGEFAVVSLTVTDAFGNLQGVTSNPVSLSFDDSSPGRFGSGLRTAQITPGPDGVAQITVTASSNETGTIRFRVGTAVPLTNQFGALENHLYSTSAANSAPGFAASNAPRTVEMAIKSAPKPPAVQSITISGIRDGDFIEVIGSTVGIAEGTIMRAWIRKSGQTDFVRGKAKPKVAIIGEDRGEFFWDREIGKKVRVQFRTDDGTVRSNTIIIPGKRR